MPRRIAALLLSLFVPYGIAAQKKPVTIESITAARPPQPGPAVWAPDGRRFAYQEGKKIWLYDVRGRAKRELVSMDRLEAAARKGTPAEAFDWQNRNVREQTLQWSSSGKELLISAGGDLFLFVVICCLFL